MIEMILRAPAAAIPSRKLSKAVTCFLREHVADQEAIHDLELALGEACSNVVRHAYAHTPRGDVQLRIQLEPGVQITLEITDWGKGFKPEPHCCKTVPDPTAESGRGVFLMGRLADEFDISCDGDKTVVRLVKRLPPEAWVPDEPAASAGAEPAVVAATVLETKK